MQVDNYLRILFVTIGGLLALAVLSLIIILLIALITEFKPPERTNLQTRGKAYSSVISDSIISILSWNIGYASIGAETNFFYDGGSMMRPPKDFNTRYLNGIKAFLKEHESVEFIMLQEVDKKARRSFYRNQISELETVFNDHSSAFAVNYDVCFVPLPLHNPMGRVLSGLMTFAKYEPEKTTRVSFRKDYPLPTRLFMLKRCFMIQRFNTDTGGQLVLINTHNSAFDDGQLRLEQLDLLLQTALAEYDKGNWVIIGGDWNMNPPEFDPAAIANGDLGKQNDLGNIPNHLLPGGWQWIYDPTTPTNREVIAAYKKGLTPATVIDYYLISPNVEAQAVTTIDKSFELSDHNPVLISVRLMKK
jgi:endonuclease/exonuclease/phosphatase family metal-dependent hydrolase